MESAQVSMQPQQGVEIPEETARVARAAFRKGSLAMSARDELGEVFTDEQFTEAFGTRGAPAESPGALALVTALQYTEYLTDRQAGQAVAERISWKYALAMELSEEGFDESVLAKFRSRLVGHGLEQQIFDRMLEVLAEKGLVTAGGKQRTDATHVLSAVRDHGPGRAGWRERAGRGAGPGRSRAGLALAGDRGGRVEPAL
jgi:transposase